MILTSDKKHSPTLDPAFDSYADGNIVGSAGAFNSRMNFSLFRSISISFPLVSSSPVR